MYLSSLSLQNFRSYQQQTFNFSPQTNLILGPNGSGKTNLLEAIHLLSTGVSFRSLSFSKLISWGQKFTLISAQTNRYQLEVQLIQKPNSSLVSRKFLVESIVKPRRSFLGLLKTVVFSPYDIHLVTGSPSRRRHFLDSIFVSLDWRYPQALSQYTKALKHRNRLLDQIAQGKGSADQLFYWNNSLVKNDQIIHHFRRLFVDSVNQFFASHPHPQIQKLRLDYQPSPLTAAVLQKNYPQDLSQGYTHAGCHRDDFIFQSQIFPQPNSNLAFWASRGQQRLAVLALRLAQINFIQSFQKQNPILLLDDIFSELDSAHQHLVIDICQKHQTFFTSANPDATSLLPQTQTIRLP